MTDRELFIAALDRADPAERDAWLAQACAGDADCRRRVDVLLRAHDQASQFLAAPAMAQFEADSPTQTAGESSNATDLDIRAYLTPPDKPGQLGKLDHYEVIEVVGRGGMGVVLKAFDPKLHRLVAIKLMAPHLAASAAARQRFEREARAVAAVQNEHVVAIHAVESTGATPYLVMEFVGGISLQDRLEQRGSLEVKEILRIGIQSARALSAAHSQGIVHRDIKPANILLENGVERVKITDFGLARTADDANLTQSGVITGTPNYMSPEQAASATIDARSDLFSLGAVLYALCTGHPPFRADTPLAVLRRVCDDPARPIRETNPDTPDWLDAIVRKLLAKKPEDRFQSATEVAELLGQHLAHLQQPSAVPMPAAVMPPLEGVATTRPGPAVKIGCLIALVGIVGLGLLVAFRDTFWKGFFVSGYYVPVYMFGVSGFMMLVLWFARRTTKPGWSRRPWELAMVVVILGTAAALAVGWTEQGHGGKLSRAVDWHTLGLILACLIVNLPWLIRWLVGRIGTRPREALNGGPGLDLLSNRRMKLAVGAVVFVLILALVGSVHDILVGDAASREANLSISWDRGFVDRVTVERGGTVIEKEGGTVSRFGHSFPPGDYIVRGFKGDREVYREQFSLDPGQERRVTLFESPQESEYAMLSVDCPASPMTLTASSPSHTFSIYQPNKSAFVTQGLKVGESYRIDIALEQKVVHTETIRLERSERRDFHIPPIVLSERIVELKPKASSIPSDVKRMQFSPDRSLLAILQISGAIRVFHTESGEEQCSITLRMNDPNAFAFAFTPNSQLLAYISPTDDQKEYTVRFVNARTGVPVPTDQMLKPKDGVLTSARALAFSPDGKRMAVSSAQNSDKDNRWQSKIYRWENFDYKAGATELPALEWQEGTIEGLRFTSNGNELLSVGGTFTWTAWNWETRQPQRRGEGEVNFTYDRVAVGGPVEAVTGWGQLTKQSVVIFGGVNPRGFMAGVIGFAGVPVRFDSLAVSADGRLAAAGAQGTANGRWEERPAIRIWDTATQKPQAILLGHTDWPLDLAFTPDGKELISANKDGTVRFWKLP